MDKVQVKRFMSGATCRNGIWSTCGLLFNG